MKYGSPYSVAVYADKILCGKDVYNVDEFEKGLKDS